MVLTFCINSTRGRGGHEPPRWIERETFITKLGEGWIRALTLRYMIEGYHFLAKTKKKRAPRLPAFGPQSGRRASITSDCPVGELVYFSGRVAIISVCTVGQLEWKSRYTWG